MRIEILSDEVNGSRLVTLVMLSSPTSSLWISPPLCPHSRPASWRLFSIKTTKRARRPMIIRRVLDPYIENSYQPSSVFANTFRFPEVAKTCGHYSYNPYVNSGLIYPSCPKPKTWLRWNGTHCQSKGLYNLSPANLAMSLPLAKSTEITSTAPLINTMTRIMLAAPNVPRVPWACSLFEVDGPKDG